MEKKVFNKTEKKKLCKYILDNTDCIVEKKYERFLVTYVFPGHAEWDEKRGVGIDHLEVRPDGYGKRCFFIVRTDGTVTDISYPASITPHRKVDDVMAACRYAVRPIIKEVKDKLVLPIKCPVTGETLYDMEDVHIDHYNLTFKELFDKWVKEKDIEQLYKSTNSVKSNKDNSTYTYFDDDSIAKDFIAFHNAHTHLRAVSKKANLSVLKRKKS